MHQSIPPLSTELAVKTFEAEAALAAALAKVHATRPADAGNPVIEARRAAEFGFSWLARPAGEDGDGLIELRLRHQGGAEETALGYCVSHLLAGLLGMAPVDADVLNLEAPADPPAAEPALAPEAPAPVAPAAQPVQAEKLQDLHNPAQAVAEAAESLASAMDGSVVPLDDEPPAADPGPDAPLTEGQFEQVKLLVQGLEPAQRKALQIAFRDAFSVPSETKRWADHVTLWKHLEFIDRFAAEAAGGIRA